MATNQEKASQHTKSITNYENAIIDVHRGSKIRLQVKVAVPCDDHPNVTKNSLLKSIILIGINCDFFSNSVQFRGQTTWTERQITQVVAGKN